MVVVVVVFVAEHLAVAVNAVKHLHLKNEFEVVQFVVLIVVAVQFHLVVAVVAVVVVFVKDHDHQSLPVE